MHVLDLVGKSGIQYSQLWEFSILRLPWGRLTENALPLWATKPVNSYTFRSNWWDKEAGLRVGLRTVQHNHFRMVKICSKVDMLMYKNRLSQYHVQILPDYFSIYDS